MDMSQLTENKKSKALKQQHLLQLRIVGFGISTLDSKTNLLLIIG